MGTAPSRETAQGFSGRQGAPWARTSGSTVRSVSQSKLIASQPPWELKPHATLLKYFAIMLA